METSEPGQRLRKWLSTRKGRVHGSGRLGYSPENLRGEVALLRHRHAARAGGRAVSGEAARWRRVRQPSAGTGAAAVGNERPGGCELPEELGAVPHGSAVVPHENGDVLLARCGGGCPERAWPATVFQLTVTGAAVRRCLRRAARRLNDCPGNRLATRGPGMRPRSAQVRATPSGLPALRLDEG